MDYALTLSIDGHSPALNGEQGLIRLHYRSYAQKRTEWETLILAALPADVRAFFQDHHFVECEVWYLHRNKKGLDWDNCAASFKVVSDALVNLGILQDDHPGVSGQRLSAAASMWTRNAAGPSDPAFGSPSRAK